QLLPGAICLAVRNAPLEALVGDVYRRVKALAREEIVRQVFGPKGEGFYSKTRVQSLDALTELGKMPAAKLGEEVPWMADAALLTEQRVEEVALEVFANFQDLTPAERHAVFYAVMAAEQSTTLKGYCAERSISYQAVKQALS